MAFKARGRRRENAPKHPTVGPLPVSHTRVVLGDRLILRNKELFGDDDITVRRLIDEAFTFPEVRSVVVRRDRSELTIELTPIADPVAVWSRLGALLRETADQPYVPAQAARLELAGPVSDLPVRIARAGSILTTFRTRLLSQEHMRIGHPLLRQRLVRERFEEFLRSIHGITDIRMIGLSASAHVTYDPSLIDAEQVLRLLEGAWPELVSGTLAVTTPKMLFLAASLLAFSFFAQFINPTFLPVATAAVALYSLPNLIAAIRDLKRGRIGLPALYSAGLGFLLWTRMPFASNLMAVLSQLWPALASRMAASSERGLFAEYRRRLAWARLNDGQQGEIIIGVDDLVPEAKIIARAGDFLPVDGVVVNGHAAVDEDMLNGRRGAADKIVGDRVYAGSFVRDGALVVRAERVGGATASAALARALPHGALRGLPSSAYAERIANRNAKPALAAAALVLLVTRTPRLSQVIIRPDYATAPRLSAHLSALTALAESLSHGALIRRPAALDHLLTAEAFVFDDGLDFSARDIEVGKINVVTRAGAQETLSLAAAAFGHRDEPRARAVWRELTEEGGTVPLIKSRSQYAGELRCHDEAGALISVATPHQALQEHFTAPTATLANLLHKLALDPPVEPDLRPLVVARDREIIGILQFAARGAHHYAGLVTALRTENPQARFIHLSSASQEQAGADSEEIGFDAVLGGLTPQDKREILRSLGLRTAWIGNGADPASTPVRAASAVSISLAGLDSLPHDNADIVLLRDDLRAVLALRTAAQAHIGRLRADYRTVYFTNLLAVVGGFTAGFGGLQAGLTSNLGSAAVFFGRWRKLVALSSRAERLTEARRNASNALTAPRAR